MRIKSKKRKIAIIAGSRGEYGYFRPLIKEIKKRPSMDYGIIASSMHMLDAFGSTIEEIKRDRFKIHAAIHNTFDGYNRLTMSKSLAVFMLQLPELIDQMGADMILLSGDRGEQLMAAIVGAHMYIPVAHIQAGEISGNIDGLTRHAITRFAHLHFCANKDAKERVLKMGEEPFRIFNVGAPQLDDLVNGNFTPQKEIYKKFSLAKDKPVILFIYHSVTEEVDELEYQINEAMKALSRLGQQTIVVLNNADAGSKIIRNKIMERRTHFMRIFPNIKRQDYAGLMAISSVIVGNSSSGIIEAPTFKLPAVNIGNRQRGRLQGENVINVGYSEKEIERGIKKAMLPSFQKRISKCKNLYGEGNSSRKIADILEKMPIDDKLLTKRLTY
jgi:GDP/UDP-N,N'-diacetylbacillosamine 2-epimerase (hydrolysing)